MKSCLILLLFIQAWALGPGGAHAADPYAGPLLDAHSHLPGPQVLDTLIPAMDRQRVARIALLGVGSRQPEDATWILAAAQRHPGRIIPVAPVPDPTAPDTAERLERLLATGAFKGAGETQIHHASGKIRRTVSAPAFLAVLDVCARHGVPLVVHDELTPETTADLERALGHNRQALVVLAHAGSGEPGALRSLLARHANLYLDISGMHFLRTPALASERGPLKPEWRALFLDWPDRILVGVDLWAARLYQPELLDRLFSWTRRILGELPADAAARLAHRNAERLFRVAQ